MPVYKYKAISKSGKSVEGVIDADSSKLATDKLKGRDVYLSSIEEVRQAKSRRMSLFGGISTAELSITTRQFSTLVSAGLPLEASLSALAEQSEDDRLGTVLAGVREKINEGSTLANALGDHPKVFSELYRNLVRAGEASGTLDIVLERLADFLEKQVALRSRVKGAMMYPIFMFCIGSGVLFFMMTFVIPKIAAIFESSNTALPFITIVLLNSTRFLSNHTLLFIIVCAALGFGILKLVRTAGGRRTFDRYVYSVPIFGKIARLIMISRFTRTLGTLISSGIPLLEALEISEAVVGNSLVKEALERVRVNLIEGSSFSAPLRDTGMFPPLVTRMISVGEQTGELDNMLIKVADSYDLQVDTSVSTITSLLEPVMILIMGVVIGLIVFAILMPIFNLTSTIR